ncbi:MAG: phosphatidate cytidylyltransferase [Rhodobacteraceae bacterium]|nr:phosphatidate cytidylyltransferase [Paracoccaceae bacterium]
MLNIVTRLISALILASIALAALFVGGFLFPTLCALAAGFMLWEVSSLSSPDISRRLAIGIGVVAALASFAATALFPQTPVADLHPIGIALLAAFALDSGRIRFALTAAAILQATHSLALLRLDAGISISLWLILTVVATDTGAYIAGKLLGGPKLLPKLSPNKTWSGAVGGLCAAVLVGFAFLTQFGMPVIVAAPLVSICAQFGDLAESWLKRQAGAKDSSSLIPGHGGVCDRFDGMVGGCLGYWLLNLSGINPL